MNEILNLIKTVGYPILILMGIITLVGFGIFVWFARKIFRIFGIFFKGEKDDE